MQVALGISYGVYLCVNMSTKSVAVKKRWDEMTPDQRLKRMSGAHKARWDGKSQEERTDQGRKMAVGRWGNKKDE